MSNDFEVSGENHLRCLLLRTSSTTPSADLWELFAGRALCTEMAAQCGLVALQPWDLIYGQDLMDSSTRHEAFKVIKRFRPYLLIMGLECRHYTRFNRNLNYSHRLDEWYELQHEDRPLLDLSADLAETQHRQGRFFMLENLPLCIPQHTAATASCPKHWQATR